MDDWAAGVSGEEIESSCFAGIVVELLSEWGMEMVRNAGESEEQARERVGRKLAEEKYFNVSAHLKRPESFEVGFGRR